MTTTPTTTTDWVGRIKWTTLARVVALSVLLVFGIAMDLGMGPLPISQFPEIVLYKVVTAFFILSFVALLGTYLLAERYASVLAWTTLAIDVLLAAALVVISHGTDSVFLFAMPLAVLSGSALLKRRGAYAAATACSLLLVAVAFVDLKVVPLDLEPWTVSWLRTLGPRHPAHVFGVTVSVLVQTAALYGTAVLAARFVLELARARARTEDERRELAALRVRYEDVVSSMPDGLVTVTSAGRIGTCNPAFARIMKADAAALIGRRLHDVMPELADLSRVPADTIEIRRSKFDTAPVADRQEVVHKGPGGDQFLAVRVAVLRSPEGVDGSIVVVRDITEIRGREAAHRSRERLAAIGEMAMAIAHEIRNPLASISGAVQMLQSGGANDGSADELMTIAVRETSQLSAWIGEFLDFARPGRSEPSICDLRRVVDEKLLAFRQDPRVAEHGVEVELLADPDADYTLLADEKQLSSMVWNLLTNALQELVEIELRTIRVHLLARLNDVVVQVDDSGRGVPADERLRVFEPFYTTKGEGTGLGLAQVRRVAEQHGGSAVLTDSSLGGARFEVSLPRRSPLMLA